MHDNATKLLLKSLDKLEATFTRAMSELTESCKKKVADLERQLTNANRINELAVQEAVRQVERITELEAQLADCERGAEAVLRSKNIQLDEKDAQLAARDAIDAAMKKENK